MTEGDSHKADGGAGAPLPGGQLESAATLQL